MSQRYEYYITGSDDYESIHGKYWAAQTFTPSIAHKITSVKLKVYRLGSPGILTVSIRTTSGGHPTGEDLCSGTTDGNTLTTNSGGEWREITLGAGYNLSADTQYAIVVRAIDATGSNYVRWRNDHSGATYVGGYSERSTNSGDSWTSYTGADWMFEEWGEPIAPPAVGMSHAFIIG